MECGWNIFCTSASLIEESEYSLWETIFAYRQVTSVLLLGFYLHKLKITSKIPARSRHLQGKGNLYMGPCFALLSSLWEPWYFTTFLNLFEYTSCRRRYFPIPSGKNVIKGGKPGEVTIHVNSSWCTLITKHCQGERRTKSKADAVVWKNRTTVYLWFSAWIACEVYTVVLMGLHNLGLHLLNHNSRIDIVNTFLTFCAYSKFYREKFYIKIKSIETLESYCIFG